MNINIRDLTKGQLVDLQNQIEKQLEVSKFPPKGTICEVWDDEGNKTLKYADGEGCFKLFSNSDIIYAYKNYRVVEQGLTFSDEVITSKDFTKDMDRQLCLCWDAEMMPVIRAIDYDEKRVFKSTGTRSGAAWSYYRLCTTPYELMPQLAKDIVNKLED